MTERISSRLIEALRAAGIPAYPEYPQILRPLPPDPFFVTAACTEAVCGAPVETLFGDAVTASLTIRLRMHCRTDNDPAAFAEKTEQCILQTLRDAACDLRGIRQVELHYVRELDRLVCEVLLQTDGTVFLSGGEPA